jgi:two-component system phosphate regulon response regulator PhoB
VTPRPDGTAAPAHVLVVDDDPDVRELVALRLRLDGYEVQGEADGEAGLAAATARPPALVIADWMMPRLSGLELCRALRRDPATAAVPVLLLTARTQEDDVQRAFAAGADDYILKPFSPRELSSRVGAVLARSASPRPVG